MSDRIAVAVAWSVLVLCAVFVLVQIIRWV